MIKIGITGGSGFLGSCIVENLLENKNFEVINIGRTYKEKCANVHLDFLEDDLSKISKLNLDYLISCAWLNGYREKLNSKENNLWLDVSIKVADNFFKNENAKKITFLGSFYEDQKKDTVYSAMKTKLKEKMFQKYEKILWCKVCNIFGENENAKKIIPYVVENIKKEETLYIKEPLSKPCFISKGRATREIIEATLNDDILGDISISENENITILQLCGYVSEILRKDPKIESKELFSKKDLIFNKKDFSLDLIEYINYLAKI